jgi:hypothetical protein
MTEDKQFDAVEWMRSVREKLSEEIAELSPAEQLTRLNRPLSDPLLERIRRMAAGTAAAIDHPSPRG